GTRWSRSRRVSRSRIPPCRCRLACIGPGRDQREQFVDMSPRAELTLRALVQRTGIPATTIHHYSRLGLLPEPERVAPNRFHYDERHVQALRLVRLLRERRRLPLDTIRRVLPALLAVEDDAFLP